MKHYSLGEIAKALSDVPDMPYALMKDARGAMVRTAVENPSYAWVYGYLRGLIDRYRREPVEIPSYTAYAAWAREGERGRFDAAMYSLRTRLNMMCVAVLLDIDGAKELYEDALYVFLHLPTWSLAAHHFDRIFSDTWDDIPRGPFDETGRIRGLGRSRKQCLDLCSTSAAFGIAESCQMLEGRVEGSLLRWARQECFDRVLGNFMSLAPFPHFEINPNNWSGVCLSSIGGAAIYLIIEPKTLAPVIMRVLEGLSVHLGGYYDDGASPEGFGYWQYGFEYFLMFADLLKARTGGRIDLLQDEKVRRIAGFGADCCLPDGLKLPFGDCSVRGIYNEAIRRFIGAMGLPVPDEGDTLASFKSDFEHGNLLIRDLAWDMRPVPQARQWPRSAVYPVSEMYMGFYRTTADPVCLMVKGGNNGESHNHNDVGNYVIMRGRRMLAADISGGKYSKDYFGDKRYTFFGTRSAGHNLPMIDGAEQIGHGSCRCRAFTVETRGGKDVVTMDLTGTLKAESLTALTRRVEGDPGTGSIRIRDSFSLNRPAQIKDRVILPGGAKKTAPGAWRVGGDDGMTLSFDASLFRAELNPTDQFFDSEPVWTLDIVPIECPADSVTIGMEWRV